MNFHVVLEGHDKFQKEEERAFPNNQPPPTLILRQFESLSITPLPCYSFPISEPINVKERVFRLKDQFYALGKQIAHYQETR